MTFAFKTAAQKADSIKDHPSVAKKYGLSKKKKKKAAIERRLKKGK
jgi:hypothetical protein